ncbi:MAG: hypothetical protein IJJ99_02690 [Oscillospiraceae bacterium]|nr:hypothetical protein [Oscillospiraceae bacterium]
MEQTFHFSAIPENVAQLQAIPEAALTSPFQTAALTALALCRYETDPAAAVDLLNYLKGPQPLSPFEVQFLRDRLSGKGYVARSYFAGTSPANNYAPTLPYAVTVFDGPYSYQQDGYAKLMLRSSGADSPREVMLRRKGAQWFLWENYLLPDVRVPAALDPWA